MNIDMRKYPIRATSTPKVIDKAQGDIYVMLGEPKDWQQQQPMGPFTSEAKARKAIREDCQNSLASDDELKLGSHESYFEKYTIVKIVKSFQPVTRVKADITLKNL